ncbi:hypothetical protein ATK30_6198 [Amycolatopsis echigonensis]|uniref:Uncharacterized protein n=1 Tax=Amycolatopsis echigonensis TaxID=2576905 RepID=A0A2N3WN37_9PSEU|nr:hypothetical protein ATK30_6198 [Amycolatopsis niigatensis]
MVAGRFVASRSVPGGALYVPFVVGTVAVALGIVSLATAHRLLRDAHPCWAGLTVQQGAASSASTCPGIPICR